MQTESKQSQEMSAFLTERGIDSIEKLTEIFEPHFFAIIPVDVLERTDLKPNAKLVYGEITALTKRSGYCFATDRYIGERIGIEKDTVQKLISELADAGLLERHTEKRDGGTFRKISVRWTPFFTKTTAPKVKTEKLPKEAVALPDWLNKESWGSWEKYKKEKRQGLTPSTIKKQLSFLELHKKDHVAIIEQSIEKGWQGLFPIKGAKSSAPAQKVPAGKYDHVKSTL